MFSARVCKSMKTIESTVDIRASPAAVWAVLTDFESYPEWNPFITRAEGAPAAGERLRIHVDPPEGRGMTFRPRVVHADTDERLVWQGKLGISGLFDGRHEFLIEPNDDGTVRFTQREVFTGLLVGLLLDEADVRAGFDAMGEALAERVGTDAAAGRESRPQSAGLS
jgi:hypothetical protein